MTTPGAHARRAVGLSFLLASTLAALGCYDDPSSPAEQEITIGGLFSLTGNWASLGVASKAAMEIGIEDVNAYLADGNSGLHAATQPDFAAALASLKTQVEAAIAERGGTATVAVAHAGFDEVVDIFKAATTDPVLSSVRWYGTDGTALTEPLRTDATAAAFARKVNFWAPIPGVDREASDRWQPIATRIAARAGGAQPDAFGLAVYDAVWVTAQAYLAAGGRGDAAALKTAFVTAANSLYGASGWTALNAAGDRRFGNFDFFALSLSGTSSAWSLRAQYDTQRRVLTRVP